MINKVILVGRITRDPELRTIGSGVACVNFTVACNRPFQDQQGERAADFINCVVWRKQAENLARYVKKGALIGIEGRIQTRNYEADGQTRYVTEVLCDNIQFLEAKQEASTRQAEESDPFMNQTKYVDDDDVPF